MRSQNSFQTVNRFFRHFRAHTRLRIFLQSLTLSQATLLVYILLLPDAFERGEVLWGVGALGVVCLAGSWLMANRWYCLRMLYAKNAELAEKVQIALELEQTKAQQPGTNYFSRMHQERVVREIAQQPPFRWLQLLAPLSLMVVVAGLLGVTWLNMHRLPDNPLRWVRQGNLNQQQQETYRILYPAYTARAPHTLKELRGEIGLPNGSRLEIRLPEHEINHAARQTSYYESGENRQKLSWHQTGQNWQTQIQPQQSGSLHRGWKRLDRQVDLDVLADQPPRLTVQWPENAKKFANGQLQVTLATEDDYGIKTIHLYYENQNGVGSKEVIQSFEGVFTTHEEVYPWELGITPLRSGDQVRAWIEVTDNDALTGPHVTKSEVFEFTVEDAMEFHRDLLDRVRQLEARLEYLLSALDRRKLREIDQEENELIRQIGEINQDAQFDSLLAPELRRLINQELEYQLRRYQRKRRGLEKAASG